MNFKFEFLNIHISHLAQLIMISISLKCQEKTYVKKFTISTTIRHGFWFLYLYSNPNEGLNMEYTFYLFMY
jgi:hypothetical protein